MVLSFVKDQFGFDDDKKKIKKKKIKKKAFLWNRKNQICFYI